MLSFLQSPWDPARCGPRPAILLWAIWMAFFAALVTPASADDQSVRVSVTTKPIHSLVTQVMQGVASPQLIVEGSSSPHTFSLRPSTARAIAESGVFIRVSDATEPFTHKLIESLPADVTVLTLADAKLGVALLPLRHSGAFEPHENGAGDEERLAHHAIEATGEGVDGHIWLDPENAKMIVRAVADTLSKRWPEHASQFELNAKQAEAHLAELSDEIKQDVSGVESKPFIVFHDAYQYFERRYGVNAAGAVTLSPEQPPSAKRLAQVRQKVFSAGAVCIFAEPGFQPKLLSAVTEGSSVRTATLDPEGQSLEPGAALYDVLLRTLAQHLVRCLTGMEG